MVVPRLYIAVTSGGVERVTIDAPSPQARDAAMQLYRKVIDRIFDLDTSVRNAAAKGDKGGNGIWIEENS